MEGVCHKEDSHLLHGEENESAVCCKISYVVKGEEMEGLCYNVDKHLPSPSPYNRRKSPL